MRGVYKSVGTEESKWIGKILVYWSEREREIIYICIYFCTCINPPYFAEREYFVSVGIGRILFFSVASLSSLDEGHSIVSLKCWMPLRLTYIFSLCLYCGSAHS